MEQLYIQNLSFTTFLYLKFYKCLTLLHFSHMKA